MKLLTKIIDLLFPHRCPLCGEILEETAGCCKSCREELVPVKTVAKLRYISRVAAVCSYTGLAAEAVIRMKFAGRPDLTEGIGRMMAEAVRNEDGLPMFDGILPVPMTRRDVLRRGFCQTKLLAKVIGRELSVPVLPGALRKIRQTRQQHRLSKEERLKNVLGAYAVADPAAIAGKHLLLCDDVITTGTTVDQCAKVLLEAGALSVAAVTFTVAE